ncbi:MAG: hypothetical protein N3B14_00330 [Thermoleophilia bacterium]|nr:hypothetical protein [Thermoleophilia bacterium]
MAPAKADPEKFLVGLGGTCIVDEVQRAPELLIAIKARVDRERRPVLFPDKVGERARAAARSALAVSGATPRHLPFAIILVGRGMAHPLH